MNTNNKAHLQKKDSFIITKKILSIYLALFPIISLYIFAGSITWGQIGLVVILLVCVFDIVKSSTIHLYEETILLIFYSAAVVLNTILLIGNDIFREILPRNILQFLYYSAAALFLKSFIDSKTFFSALRFISLFASIYLIIQAFFLLYGYYLPGYIPGLKVTRNDLSIEYYNQLVEYGINRAYRVRSIFGEGAEFCQYVLCYLLLIIDKKGKKATIEKVIISCAILLSASNLGIIILVILWIIFFTRRLSFSKIFLFFGALILTILLAKRFRFIDIVIRRLFDTSSNSISLGSSFYARFSGYATVKNMNFSIEQFIFGHGIIQLKESFMPSNLGHYVCFGLFGVIAYTLFSISCYRRGNINRKRLVILLSIIGFAANLGFYNFTLFTLTLMMTDFIEEDILHIFHKNKKFSQSDIVN